MKVYIQIDNKGNFFNVNAFLANEGFEFLGWEIQKYKSYKEIKDDNPENIVVGGIANVRGHLGSLGISFENHSEIDYPESLNPFLKRRIWNTTINDLYRSPDNWNIFIKPKNETKKFTGKIIKEAKDFIGLLNHEEDTEIWCSEIVEFVTEWRCFIRYGVILDIRYYKGAWDSRIDLTTVKNAIDAFTHAPAAYALDFAVDKQGNMFLVEVNDGHSLGTYGLGSISYVKFLSARWAEITETEDYLSF